jgi:hypothetical protein
MAGSVYVNGVKADGLRNQEFKDVNVKIDGNGNVYVDAPNYTVQVVDPTPVNPPPRVAGDAAPVGKYWVVTEDSQSSGNTVELVINGNLVRRVASGEPQLILDIGPYLRVGDNSVTITAIPGAQPAGGPFHVYIGTGSNDSGTVRMNAPIVHFVRKASDPATGMTRQYNLPVQ